jgi:dipeptidyl aminopeptidase/acylaminoacyl peptidase
MYRKLIPILLLAVPCSVAAQEHDAATHQAMGHEAEHQEVELGEAWTPELAMEFRGVSVGAISPDGDLVAYVIREPLMDGEESTYRSHIWVASADGAWSRQFTRGEQSASNPSFSPDGRYLAFTTSRSGKNQVWAIPLQGGEAFQVTDAPEGVGGYAISPDGSHIAFTMTDPESEETKTAKKEKRDVIVADADFRFTHIWVGPFGHSEGIQAHSHPLTSGDFTAAGFDWSPDGQSVVFAHRPDPRINTGMISGDISIVTMAHEEGAETGEGEGDEEAEGMVDMDHTFPIRPLVTGAGVEGNPRFSPDGRFVAFSSSGDQAEPVGLGDVYVVPAEGGDSRKLANTHDRSAGIVGWTGDGSAVLVVETMGTTRHLQAVPLSGEPARALTSGAGVMGGPAFTPGMDRMAFTWQTSDSPPEVFVSSVEDWEPSRVTDVHADVPMPEMGRTELLTWRSQDGRFEIEGLLTYPVGWEPGQQVPLILNVHGGPAGAFTQSFTGSPSIYMIQTFAQEGYAVLRPNPRGSTGYGMEFRHANVRDWGYGDMDDLMAGVDHVIEMGVGDPDRLLLMGWSYGGYMTSFAVTRTDRFKAASMGAGLPNLISMVTTTDIQDYLAAHLDSEFWEDYEAYERHSAMYRIANVTTPTQVIHGANDLRVPFTQGQEFYRALQRRGVPTEMLILPRTPHGPREPKLLMEVTPRILTWFEKYLPDGSPRITTQDGS